MAESCKVCDAPVGDAQRYVVPEMMYGTRQPFEYFLCASCGCLQITEIPTDISRHYPSNYYSNRAEASWRVWLKGQRVLYDIGKRSLFGARMSRTYGADNCARAIRLAGIGKRDAILDVGGGSGSHLRPLRAAGFKNLLGVDPFVQQESFTPGMNLRRMRLQDVQGHFRLIMMHHSFEHMPDPHEVLDAARERLSIDGALLIRIPMLGYGWETYGVNWVELDAPRHFFLHTPDSFRRLVERHGFLVDDLTFDSTELEIWGSEQYVRGIAHVASNSYETNPSASEFSAEEISRFRSKIAQLNDARASGRGAFILRKATS